MHRIGKIIDKPVYAYKIRPLKIILNMENEKNRYFR